MDLDPTPNRPDSKMWVWLGLGSRPAYDKASRSGESSSISSIFTHVWCRGRRVGGNPHAIRVTNWRHRGDPGRTCIGENFESYPVNTTDRGRCKKETYVVPASKNQEHSAEQQGKSNVDAFKHVDCSRMHTLSVSLIDSFPSPSREEV